MSNTEAQAHLCSYPDEIVHVLAELKEESGLENASCALISDSGQSELWNSSGLP